MRDGNLQDCPESPNCVCSDATDPARWIAPFSIKGDRRVAWQGLCDCVRALPRSRIVRQSDEDLHGEVRSRIFGFVDDLEFRLRVQEGVIALRSASRTGHWDLGVNRRRLERLRRTLRSRGLVA